MRQTINYFRSHDGQEDRLKGYRAMLPNLIKEMQAEKAIQDLSKWIVDATERQKLVALNFAPPDALREWESSKAKRDVCKVIRLYIS